MDHIALHHSAMERSEAPSHATAWMDLGDMMLSERSEPQKALPTCCMYRTDPGKASPLTRGAEQWLPGVGNGTQMLRVR